jgi:hypothetical protein
MISGLSFVMDEFMLPIIPIVPAEDARQYSLYNKSTKFHQASGFVFNARFF